ncbi:MAG: dolichyl-phosphate beta-glucosyltransferase [Cirrosporium novae-zelandiae]|nr:MAG: dolichyl-phosphate beta-glucosyltransferase [Cirrosporium novae-zelandiae]
MAIDSWDQLVPIAILIGAVVFFVGIVPLTFFVAPTYREPEESEKKYQTVLSDGSVSKPKDLPCWYDVHLEDDSHLFEEKEEGIHRHSPFKIEPAEVFLSLVVPAFNEEKRLGEMLDEAVNYLQKELGIPATASETNGVRKRKSDEPQQNGYVPIKLQPAEPKGWEILVVSDGSFDDTVNTALRFAREKNIYEHPDSTNSTASIRVISLSENRGKGAAVTHGMRHVRGKYIIFADADGATRFQDLGKLIEKCREVEDSQGRAVIVGSRSHLADTAAVVKRSHFRNILMKGFHAFIKFLTPKRTSTVKDTQCGFKLFSRESLVYIIPFMISEGWIFDVEMLMHAEASNIPFAEVAVDWHEIPGSKLNALQASFGMAFGLLGLRFGWLLGTFTVRQNNHR